MRKDHTTVYRQLSFRLKIWHVVLIIVQYPIDRTDSIQLISGLYTFDNNCREYRRYLPCLDYVLYWFLVLIEKNSSNSLVASLSDSPGEEFPVEALR